MSKICATHDIQDEGVFESEEIVSELANIRNNCNLYLDVREDFRGCNVFTIDPRTCRDMDDAVHVRELDSCYEIGVHIADVGNFVNEIATPNLFQHAKLTSTSFYFPHKVFHMLPVELSADLCSLMPHVDRFTMSMTWKVEKNSFRIIDNSFRYGKGLIRSRAKLAYEDVQVVMDFFDTHGRAPTVEEAVVEFNRYDEKVSAGLDNYIKIVDKFREEDFSETVEKVIADAITLTRFTRKLEQTRNRLVLHSRMRQFVNFSLDAASSTPTDIVPTKTIEANKVIENLMLLANEYAAKTIVSYYPETAMLRKHSGLVLEDVLKTTQKLIDVIQDRRLVSILKEVQAVVATSSSGNVSKLLEEHCSREMK